MMMQTTGVAVDDVWGGMGLTDEAVQDIPRQNNVFNNSDYTQFGSSSTTNSTQKTLSSETPIEKEQRLIRDIEIYGLNSVAEHEIREKIQMKQGGTYSRDLLQTDLKTIYQMGYFTEKMKAIPSKNEDGSVTVKIVVEENIPVKDFTIEGNSVIPIEDILATLNDMKGKPQNIAQLNVAISQIQELYTSKGYILARIDSVTDDPDGTINISIKEGIIDKIMTKRA